LLEMYLTKKMEAERTGHVSDPELGTLTVPPGPGTGTTDRPGSQSKTNAFAGQHQAQQGGILNQPEPARVHARGEPVRAQPGYRYGVPSSTNGKIRRPDGEMAMAALDYGVRTMSSRSNLLGEKGDGRNGNGNHTSNGRSIPRTKEGIAVAALQYGARAALDAHSNARSKSAGRV
jgi:hypothetical protein